MWGCYGALGWLWGLRVVVGLWGCLWGCYGVVGVAVGAVTVVGRQAPSLRVPGGDTVYDYSWFPSMDSALPESCLCVRLPEGQRGKWGNWGQLGGAGG